LVGGLIATVSPEEETEQLNECAAGGWELLTVTQRKYQGHDYIIYYFRRKNSCDKFRPPPRFDLTLFRK
jgi:hypothetical protein